MKIKSGESEYSAKNFGVIDIRIIPDYSPDLVSSLKAEIEELKAKLQWVEDNHCGCI